MIRGGSENDVGDSGVRLLAPTIALLTGLTSLDVSSEWVVCVQGCWHVVLTFRTGWPGEPGNSVDVVVTDRGKSALLKHLLEANGPPCKQRDVMWKLVTPGSLSLLGMPQGLARSWNAFLAFVSESASAGVCTDGVHASVVVVGHEGAGKTTLAARLTTGRFRDDTKPTVGLATCTLEAYQARCAMLGGGGVQRAWPWSGQP